MLIAASSQQAPHIIEISLVSATRKAVLSGIKKMISLVQGNEEYSEAVPSGTTVSNFRIPCNVYTAQVILSFLHEKRTKMSSVLSVLWCFDWSHVLPGFWSFSTVLISF